MSLTAHERRALDFISEDLSASDPALAERLDMFARVTAGEVMPTREQIGHRWWGLRKFAGRTGHPARRWLLAVVIPVLLMLAAVLTGLTIGTSNGQGSCSVPWAAACMNPSSSPGHTGK
jgi:Protein of unknown function (DUF3040)